MRIFGIILILFIGHIAFGQTDKDLALAKAQEAIKLMDNGQVDKSIDLLKEAIKLDPDRFDYPYELAYAFYLKEDYKRAIKTLEKNSDHENINDRYFQLLGNAYDVLGESEKAFEVYDQGIEKFPNSGRLYLEKGNVYWGKEEYGNALQFYEKGIEMAPQFSSNYYRATLIYCSSTEEVWGMIYGEIFMNIERNSHRTSEISKLLFDTYKREFEFTSDTSFSVSFSKNASINISDNQDIDKMKLPFGVGVYEPTLIMAMINEKSIDINSLDRIRTRFIDSYFENGKNKEYPNILFEYQNKVKEQGHIEAYNHWILMKGDEAGFEEWYNSNKDKWEEFIKWFTDNGLVIDNTNKFSTSHY